MSDVITIFPPKSVFQILKSFPQCIFNKSKEFFGCLEISKFKYRILAGKLTVVVGNNLVSLTSYNEEAAHIWLQPGSYFLELRKSVTCHLSKPDTCQNLTSLTGFYAQPSQLFPTSDCYHYPAQLSLVPKENLNAVTSLKTACNTNKPPSDIVDNSYDKRHQRKLGEGFMVRNPKFLWNFGVFFMEDSRFEYSKIIWKVCVFTACDKFIELSPTFRRIFWSIFSTTWRSTSERPLSLNLTLGLTSQPAHFPCPFLVQLPRDTLSYIRKPFWECPTSLFIDYWHQESTLWSSMTLMKVTIYNDEFSQNFIVYLQDFENIVKYQWIFANFCVIMY